MYLSWVISTRILNLFCRLLFKQNKKNSAKTVTKTLIQIVTKKKRLINRALIWRKTKSMGNVKYCNARFYKKENGKQR